MPSGNLKTSLIAEPDAFARAGIKQLLTESGWSVAAEAASPGELATLEADLLVYDASLFSETVRTFTGKTLAIVRGEDELRAVLRVRTDAVLSRTTGPDCIADALARLNGGKRYHAPDVVRSLTDLAPPPESVLTRQERRVAELLKTGASNEAVAEALGLGTQTVRNYNTAVYKKLGVENRAGAILKLNGLA